MTNTVLKRVIVISGIPGAGKSTASKVVAKDLELTLYDVDDHIPTAMKEKMIHGIPLTDEDREVYLKEAIKKVNTIRKTHPVLFTSPLFTQRHRKMIYEAFDKPLFIWLEAPFEVLEKRVISRSTNHFVNPNIFKKLYEHNELLKIPHIIINAQQPLDKVIKEIKDSIRDKNAPIDRLKQ